MRHICAKRAIGTMLVICMFSAVNLYAKTTQESIDDAKNQIKNLQEQKENAQDKVDNLNDKKDDLESDLGSLNSQLSQIANSMNDLEAQITQKEEDISRAQQELEAAQERSGKQYEDMKLRIQFMYENASVSAWQVLLEAPSFLEFLNRTEYIAEINSYDRKKLAEFQELQEQIAEKKASMEKDKELLVAMQEDMKKKQSSVNGLILQTRENIAETAADISDAQSDVDEISKKLAEMIAYEEQLEIQKAKEDAERLAQIKEQEKEDTSGVVYVPEESDTYLLGAIIQCESEGEPYEGKLAVGSVVLNRVKSSYFPNTISGVIYQPRQFSPVASGRLAYRLEAGVNSECLRAAQEVLNGNITINSLYFRTNNGIVQGTVIGHHVFY
ncbi:MAG: cell wall hydrolase [Clostridiales bacterium]|nr:cell wall hydrolase [Clostridiales bacterium]